MKKKLMILSGFVLVLAPVVALAQVSTGGSTSVCDSTLATSGTMFTLLCRFGQLLNAVVPVLIALGVLYFVWGVITYMIAQEEEAKKAGRNRIIYGIIGLAVIIGIWGLVNLLRNTFGLNNTQNVTIPTVPIVIPGSQ
jgi:hypothetical protein